MNHRWQLQCLIISVLLFAFLSFSHTQHNLNVSAVVSSNSSADLDSPPNVTEILSCVSRYCAESHCLSVSALRLAFSSCSHAPDNLNVSAVTSSNVSEVFTVANLDLDSPPNVTDFVTCVHRYCADQTSEKIPALPNTCRIIRDGKFRKYDNSCRRGWRDLLQNLHTDGSNTPLTERNHTCRQPRHCNLRENLANSKRLFVFYVPDGAGSLKWADKLGVNYVVINGDLGRMVSESYWVMRWIAQNYDCLPEYVAFFHGRPKDWHRQTSAFAIAMKSIPQYLDFLSKGNGADRGKGIQSLLSNLKNDGRLGPSILAITQALFGHPVDLSAMMDAEDLRTEGCCTESVINRDAIRYWPLRTYYSFLCLVQHYPVHTPWGWSFEHSWQMIFQSGIKRDMEFLGWNKGLRQLVNKYSS